MSKLKAIKIALLIVILAEEIRSARKAKYTPKGYGDKNVKYKTL